MPAVCCNVRPARKARTDPRGTSRGLRSVARSGAVCCGGRHVSSGLTAPWLVQDMSNGGWWRLTYVDADWRVLYANTGNVFVLAK